MGLNDGKDANNDIGAVAGEDVSVVVVGGGGDNSMNRTHEDDDLTNLTWLQDRNLLKSMTVTSDVKDDIVRFLKEENENVYPDDESSSSDGAKDDTNFPYSVPPVPYNPQVHIHTKPPYSFSSLIFMAIESSPNKALPVKDIYAWIVEHFPYYQSSHSGWKNTVRHNLSLNKCFKKLDKGKDELVPIVGKGSLWCVDPDLRPNLLQAVRRTPAHIYPYMSTAKTNFKTTVNTDLTSSTHKNQNLPNKVLTLDQIPQTTNSPLLGKRLLIPIINRESEEADAAESMLTLTRYSSDDSNVIIIDDKSEVVDIQQDVNSTPVIINPTGDHNYFIRNNGSKKQDIEIVPATQDLEIEISSDTTLKQEIDILENVTIVSDGKKTRGTVLVKRKVDINDEDGLKGAQALLNLASRSLEVNSGNKLSSSSSSSKQNNTATNAASNSSNTAETSSIAKRTRRSRN